MGRRATLTLATIAVASMAVLGVAQAAPVATIAVGNNFLAPSSKTISSGTKLRFRWAGGVRHHIVKTKGPGGHIHSPSTRSKGVHLAKILTKRGAYRFVCTIHPRAMRLNLTVR